MATPKLRWMSAGKISPERGSGQRHAHDQRHRHAQRGHVVAEVAAGLLHHVDLLDRGRKAREELGRQRPGEAQLERGCLGQRLAHVVVEGAGDDDANLGVAHLDAVEVARLGKLNQGVLALVGHAGARHGVGGHHHVLAGLALVVAGRGGIKVALVGALDHGPRVGNAHGLVENDGRVEALGDVKRLAREVVGLLGVRRVQARHAGKRGVVPRVLLVLGAVHGGVVGDEKHEACVDARVGDAHEGVCRNVQANVLHGDQRAHTAHGRANAHLEGDLLVGRPLAVDVTVLHEVLEGLGGGGAGVARSHARTCRPRPLGDGLVARQ